MFLMKRKGFSFFFTAINWECYGFASEMNPRRKDKVQGR